MPDRVLTIIMAGGEGTRLSVLATRRAKPAVPFGGIYRIVDFTFSNVMHSGLRHVGVVTQYRPHSLADHIGLGESWGLTGFGRVAKVLYPHTGAKDAAFYANTADAIYRNIEFIERFPRATEVLILSGDHIYKQDYRAMIEQHRQSGAQLTIATQTVPWEETSRFGIMVTNDEGRIVQFQEKPKVNPLSNFASLGIYVFNREALLKALREDQADADSSHDFGGDIIPRMIHSHPVYHYGFEDYWRDVGTIESYMTTSMEILDPASPLNFEAWGVRTNHQDINLQHQHASRIADGGRVSRSLVGKGSLIEGEVVNSVLSPGAWIGKGAVVRNCVLLHDVRVAEGAVLENVIADKHVTIGKDTRIGDRELGDRPNEFKPHLLNTGTTVIGKGARLEGGLRLGINTLIYPGVHVHSHHGKTEVAAGATFHDPEER